MLAAEKAWKLGFSIRLADDNVVITIWMVVLYVQELVAIL